MILAKVLVSKMCTGNNNTVIPPDGYDTTGRQNAHVIVKFDDNTFYPAYVIYYSETDFDKCSQKRINPNRNK